MLDSLVPAGLRSQKTARRPRPSPPSAGRTARLPWALAVLALGGHAWPATPGPGGGFCSPPALGAPCAVGGIATLGGTEPASGFGLGNPVHLANGNKHQLDVDLPPNASAPGLQLVRHYNGLSIQAGALGRNWTLSYDTRLQRRHDGWQLLQADGSIRKIATPLPAGQGFVVSGAGQDGRQLHFDARGLLVRVRAGKATLVHIDRHPGPHGLAGLIHRVESPTGHALQFHYGTRHGGVTLDAVDTPLGRFHYRYGLPPAGSGHGTPRLEAVARPDGMRRLYHYEASLQAGNPYSLTGISVQTDGGGTQRLATWEYDRHGRVVALHQHGRKTPSLHVDYLNSPAAGRPGLTRVRSGNGRQGLVRFQRGDGGYRLLSRYSRTDDAHARAAVAYDQAGRLAAIEGTLLQRRPDGTLAGLRAHAPGWPGLVFEQHPASGSHGWRTAATGTTTVTAESVGRPIRLRYANGDTLWLHHDAQGRPIRLEQMSQASSRPVASRLQWRGRRLRRIEHPHETEARLYDAHGRLTRRSIRRPALLAAPAAQFDERFEHDTQGRLLRHHLPEGGVLHYQWRGTHERTGSLSALYWEDARGHVRTVIDSVAGRPGYRWGNGLEMFTGSRSGPHTDTLQLAHGPQSLWRQSRRYDGAGRVRQDLHDFPQAGHHDHLVFAHDAQSRLQGALHERPGGTTRWWYAWQADGGLAAARRNQHDQLPAIGRDASGLPREHWRHALRYGPGRRLQTVIDAGTGETVAQYRHNAFGHRVVSEVAGQAVHYLYLHDQRVAEARSAGPDTPPVVTRRYLHAGLVPVGMIDYPPGRPPQLFAVHADLSGAPRLITDADRRLRWLASYSPTGEAEQVAGDLRFPLRLPGQHADEETGWHDNLLRTYAPALGQYLEPDPLGPLPGTDTYGYAGQQPWRYADPLGLLLFAFDGTRYDADSMSNAWLLAQAYRDGAAHYHSGPGNRSFLDWDAIVAWQAGRILENQWQALLSTLEHQPAGSVTPIDVIGFSRGAALARHFGNRVAAHMRDGLFTVDDPMRGRVTACVDLRFMGLFDTVAQFGIGGSHNYLYDFGINEMWSWVAHAVALHEHRWAFPLTRADSGDAGNVVEAPFVGAHADIGGGLALHASEAEAGQAGDRQNSDLAKVALGWMHWQALAASVDFDTLAADDTTVQTPLLRDMRATLARSLQQGDRAVLASSGKPGLAYQNDDPRLGRDARAQAEAFIQRYPDWRSQAGEIVAAVDMDGYARWLEDTLGWTPSP